MRIGFVTTSFPRYEGDPAGNFVFGMARAFARKGHEVKVLAPSPAHHFRPKRGEEWLEGIELIHVPYVLPRNLGRLFYGAGVPDNLSSKPWLISQAPSAVLSLLIHTAIHSLKLDSIISHWLLPSTLTVGFARRSGLKHLAIAHSTDVHMLGKLPLAWILAEKIAASADYLGFVTSTLRDEFLSLVQDSRREEVGGRCIITPMGVELEDLRTARNRQDLRKELKLHQFTVLFLGRLIPIKGVDLLIDAISPMQGVQLVVAGDGPLRGELEKRARQAGVRALFTGQVGPKKRAELFRACDVVAVPSRRLANGRSEGLPLTIIEALGAGLPVVATDLADTEKIVEENRCGVLVPSGQADEITRTFETLREDKSLLETFGKNGRQWAKGRDWSGLIGRMEPLVAL